MYKWYESAAICFAYLADVSPKPDDEPFAVSIPEQEDGFGDAMDLPWPSTSSRRDFHKSEWFCRGWTLQELLAPKEMRFLNRDWQEIGTRDDLVR